MLTLMVAYGWIVMVGALGLLHLFVNRSPVGCPTTRLWADAYWVVVGCFGLGVAWLGVIFHRRILLLPVFSGILLAVIWVIVQARLHCVF